MKHPESDEIDSFEGKVSPDDEVINDNRSDGEVIDDNRSDDEEDVEYRTIDAVRKHQFDYDMTTGMIPKYPEANPENANKKINIAP